MERMEIDQEISMHFSFQSVWEVLELKESFNANLLVSWDKESEIIEKIFEYKYENYLLLNNATLTVYNVNGSVLLTKYNSPQRIDLSSFSNGVYLANVKANNLNITQKIVINK